MSNWRLLFAGGLFMLGLVFALNVEAGGEWPALRRAIASMICGAWSFYHVFAAYHKARGKD